MKIWQGNAFRTMAILAHPTLSLCFLSTKVKVKIRIDLHYVLEKSSMNGRTFIGLPNQV